MRDADAAHTSAGTSSGESACERASSPANASATSAAVWKRSAGFFASSRSMTSESHAGASGFTVCNSGGVSSATRRRTASGVLPSKGGLPVAAS